MKPIWEFFENFDELVYVTDIHTYKLVYMNRKLREMLHFSEHDDYRGKKCYEILQGRDSECSFCTNSKLKEDEFLSWIHINPVLGKKYIIKDTILKKDKDYRIEIAIDVDKNGIEDLTYYYTRSETLLNQCIKETFSSIDPEVALNNMLAYIGNICQSDRAYIFEIDNKLVNNTYEWCREGIDSEIDNLQRLPANNIEWWIESFEKDEVIVIDDIEDIRDTHPETYNILKPQKIKSLVAGAIYEENKIKGFIGVDNPDRKMVAMISSLIKTIGHFTAAVIKRVHLLNRYSEMSFRDTLTGSFNRNAMNELQKHLKDNIARGVIFCDITGLKNANDYLGHEAGDKLIIDSYNIIKQALGTDRIFRTGGDEFIAVIDDCKEEDMYSHVVKLKNRIADSGHHIAVGYAWAENSDSLDSLVMEADKMMYKDKREYYSRKHMKDMRPTRKMLKDVISDHKRDTQFSYFRETAYFDTEAFINSVSTDNGSSYFFFGDLQRDLFYISDNMKEDFGFTGNIIPGLVEQWKQRIVNRKDKIEFIKAIQRMTNENVKTHDVKYQVRDKAGRIIWVRGYGQMIWDDETSLPVFFSGRVTRQDKEFVIDTVTNFPKENMAMRKLTEIKTRNNSVLIAGFRLNNIREINNAKGRSYTDYIIIKQIARKLFDNMGDFVEFYRLDGVTFMAIADMDNKNTKTIIVEAIRNIIESCYVDNDISVRNPVSVATIEHPRDLLSNAEIIESLQSLSKAAKGNPDLKFMDYSSENIEKLREKSNTALALNYDVMNGMKNFRIMIQPIISTESSKILSGEVLLRWTYDGRDIPPSVFVPLLEDEKIIHIVGRWVVEQAALCASKLESDGIDIRLGFNVSMYQLSDEKLRPFISEMLRKYRIDGNKLVAEITESCMADNPKELEEFIDFCVSEHIWLALDDFGSGYSSLRMLLQYPFNVVKMDKSLIEEIDRSEKVPNFIRNIVASCHELGKTVCAEGIESKSVFDAVKQTGCDTMQGYFFFRPLEIETLFRIIKENDKNIEVTCK